MSLSTNKGKGNFTPPPFENETYFARLVQIVDLGLQEGGEYEGKPKPDKDEILFTFEFHDVRNSEDKPAWLSVNMALPDKWDDGDSRKGMHKKSTLYKYLSILNPDGLYQGNSSNYISFGYNFNWKDLLGKPVQLEVKVNDEGRARIIKGSISKLPKKIAETVPELENEAVIIDMDDVTKEDFDKLFPWVQKKIANSLDNYIANKACEFLGIVPETEIKEEDLDNDIPF